jgi:hypothetical protein
MNEKTWAIVVGGLVTNLILWDSNIPYTAPEGALVEILDDTVCDIGYYYYNGSFNEFEEGYIAPVI